MYTVNKIETYHPTYKCRHGPSRLLLLLCLLCAINAALPRVGLAATYYLDIISGDDSNPGTSSAPWRTIGKAATTATAGDTVVLRDRDYGNVTFGAAVNSGTNIGGTDGEGTAPITYIAENEHGAVFNSLEIYKSAPLYYIFKDIHVHNDDGVGPASADPSI